MKMLNIHVLGTFKLSLLPKVLIYVYLFRLKHISYVLC